jgi:hypothetical protein
MDSQCSLSQPVATSSIATLEAVTTIQIAPSSFSVTEVIYPHGSQPEVEIQPGHLSSTPQSPRVNIAFNFLP